VLLERSRARLKKTMASWYANGYSWPQKEPPAQWRALHHSHRARRRERPPRRAAHDETTVFNIKTTNITLELEPVEVLKGGTSRWRWRQSIFTKDDCARLATSLAW
jgi:hypothetical protein